MKRSMEDILRSVRGELEKGMKEAVTTFDRRARNDLQEMGKRLNALKDEELRLAEKRMSGVRESLEEVEVLAPYMAALDAAIKAYGDVKKSKFSKSKSKKKASKKKRAKKKTKRTKKAKSLKKTGRRLPVKATKKKKVTKRRKSRKRSA